MAPAPIAVEERAAAFEARSLDRSELGDFLASILDDLPSWPLPSWDARALAAAALYYQPSLGVARARVAQASAAVETARTRPNPTLALAPELSSNPGTAVSPWIAAIHLDWPIETAGKRARRIERAQADVASASYAQIGEAWAVRRAVWSALVDRTSAEQRTAALAAELAAERELIALLDERVERGAAAESEVAAFRLALLLAEQELAAQGTTAAEQLARLAQVVGVPVRALDGVVLVAPKVGDDAPLALLSRDAAVRQALFTRADVLAALAGYAAAEASLRLELAKQVPDVHLGSGYQFDQGQNKWSLGLFVDLPIMNRNEGPIAEAVAARAAAAAAFDAVQARVVAEVEQAIARRDGRGLERARLASLARERKENLDRVRQSLRLGAADSVAEYGATIELLRAERARSDGDTAWLQAIGDVEAAIQPAAARGEVVVELGSTRP